MDDFSPFFHHIADSILLREKDETMFASVLRIKHVGRGQFIEEPGFVSRYRSFIVKGGAKSYFQTNDGHEHIMALAIENGWIGDAASFASGEPSALIVEATENTTLIQWSYDSEQLLLEQIPGFSLVMFRKSQQIAVGIQRRVVSLISQSAEERFAEFEYKHADLLQRFPLYVIASYLGMTREFLSRIRNQKKSGH